MADRKPHSGRGDRSLDWRNTLSSTAWHDRFDTGNIYAGLHEFADMAFVLPFLRPCDLFVDVGANVGSYTILASGLVRCHTVAFEPDPLTAAALERNVNLNQIANLVEIRVAAVGEHHGIVRFSTGLDTENHVVSAVDPSGLDVPIQTLDQASSTAGAFQH